MEQVAPKQPNGQLRHVRRDEAHAIRVFEGGSGYNVSDRNLDEKNDGAFEKVVVHKVCELVLVLHFGNHADECVAVDAVFYV